jgi:hypothetical protein
VSTVSQTADEGQPFSPLVADVFSTLFAQSAATTNTLLDLRQQMINDLEAERYAMRKGVERLMELPYMPWPDAFANAVFYPSQDLINEYKASKEAGR